jgi:hypothetical protein
MVLLSTCRPCFAGCLLPLLLLLLSAAGFVTASSVSSSSSSPLSVSDDVREAKEAFVSGLTGTSAGEVALLGAIVTVSSRWSTCRRLQAHSD